MLENNNACMLYLHLFTYHLCVILNSYTNCFWNITSPTEDGTIRINVMFLDTDVYEGVCYDNITTYDGNSVQFKLLIFT